MYHKTNLFKGKTQWHLVHSQYCATTTPVCFQISITLKGNPVPKKQLLHNLSSSQPLAITSLHSVSTGLPSLDSLYKWSHTIGGLGVSSFFH